MYRVQFVSFHSNSSKKRKKKKPKKKTKTKQNNNNNNNKNNKKQKTKITLLTTKIQSRHKLSSFTSNVRHNEYLLFWSFMHGTVAGKSQC